MKSFPVPLPWVIAAVWVSVMFLTFTWLGGRSVSSLMLLAVISLVPCGVLLKLWTEGPPPTVAEVIRATEDRR